MLIAELCSCVVVQFTLEKAEKLDGQRTAVMTFLGFGLVGPTLHFWYAENPRIYNPIGGSARINFFVLRFGILGLDSGF